MTAVDFSRARPTPAQLKAWDVTACGRYLGPDIFKNMSKAEVLSYAAVGIRTFAVFEYEADQATLGAGQGYNDASLALSQGTSCGLPAWRPIYFAVDFDIRDYAPGSSNPATKLGPVADYFRACCDVLGVDRVGVYGGYYAVKRVLDAGLASWGWQTLAWSGGQWDTRAVLRQTGRTLDGGQLDEDTAIRTHTHGGDFGAWFPGEAGGDMDLSNKADLALFQTAVKTTVVDRSGVTVGQGVEAAVQARDGLLALEQKVDQVLALLQPPPVAP